MFVLVLRYRRWILTLIFKISLDCWCSSVMMFKDTLQTDIHFQIQLHNLKNSWSQGFITVPSLDIPALHGVAQETGREPSNLLQFLSHTWLHASSWLCRKGSPSLHCPCWEAFTRRVMVSFRWFANGRVWSWGQLPCSSSWAWRASRRRLLGCGCCPLRPSC